MSSAIVQWVRGRVADPIVARARAAADSLSKIVVQNEDQAAEIVDYSGIMAAGIKELREIRRKALQPIDDEKRVVLADIDPIIKALADGVDAGKRAVQVYRAELARKREREIAEHKAKAEAAARKAAEEAAVTEEPAPPALEHVEDTVRKPDPIVRGSSTVMYASGRWSCELVEWREADVEHLKITANKPAALAAFTDAVRRGDLLAKKDGRAVRWQGFDFTFVAHEVQRSSADVRPRDDRDPAIAGPQAYDRLTRTLERNLEAEIKDRGMES